MATVEFRTARTLLRAWRPADRDPFAALNADPEVMEHFPEVLDRTESDAIADRIETHFDLHGFGLWALEIPGVTAFAGFVGLAVPRFEATFTPCVEIGWRLARSTWGHGYATEAARAVARFGFDDVGLDEIVSFTSVDNHRSRRVMERIGMTRDREADFDHPNVPAAWVGRRHVLYRLRADRARSID